MIEPPHKTTYILSADLTDELSPYGRSLALLGGATALLLECTQAQDIVFRHPKNLYAIGVRHFNGNKLEAIYLPVAGERTPRGVTTASLVGTNDNAEKFSGTFSCSVGTTPVQIGHIAEMTGRDYVDPVDPPPKNRGLVKQSIELRHGEERVALAWTAFAHKGFKCIEAYLSPQQGSLRSTYRGSISLRANRF